jgi:hypothetical protein
MTSLQNNSYIENRLPNWGPVFYAGLQVAFFLFSGIIAVSTQKEYRKQTGGTQHD